MKLPVIILYIKTLLSNIFELFKSFVNIAVFFLTNFLEGTKLISLISGTVNWSNNVFVFFVISSRRPIFAGRQDITQCIHASGAQRGTRIQC